MIDGAPDYWMHESSGVLRPVVERFLTGQAMSQYDCTVMRAYLRRWLSAPGWQGVDELRRDLEGLTSRGAISDWLARADELGIDPL